MVSRTATVVAFLVLTSPLLSAQLAFVPRPEKDAYRDLFSDGSVFRDPARAGGQPQSAQRLSEQERPDDLRQRTEEALRQNQPRADVSQPFVVCGTLIVPVDPRVDPNIRITPPNGSVDHTIRKIAPPLCRPQ